MWLRLSSNARTTQVFVKLLQMPCEIALHTYRLRAVSDGSIWQNAKRLNSDSDLGKILLQRGRLEADVSYSIRVGTITMIRLPSIVLTQRVHEWADPQAECHIYICTIAAVSFRNWRSAYIYRMTGCKLYALSVQYKILLWKLFSPLLALPDLNVSRPDVLCTNDGVILGEVIYSNSQRSIELAGLETAFLNNIKNIKIQILKILNVQVGDFLWFTEVLK